MPVNTSLLQVAAAAIAADITHVSLHSGDPGDGSANLVGDRYPVSLSAVGGQVSLDAEVEVTGLTPNVTISHLGLWTAATGGQYRGSTTRVSGDAAANAAGAYTITDIDLPGSAA